MTGWLEMLTVCGVLGAAAVYVLRTWLRRTPACTAFGPKTGGCACGDRSGSPRTSSAARSELVQLRRSSRSAAAGASRAGAR